MSDIQVFVIETSTGTDTVMSFSCPNIIREFTDYLKHKKYKYSYTIKSHKLNEAVGKDGSIIAEAIYADFNNWRTLDTQHKTLPPNCS